MINQIFPDVSHRRFRQVRPCQSQIQHEAAVYTHHAVSGQMHAAKMTNILQRGFRHKVRLF